MTQDQKPANPSQQNPDLPGNQGKKNAGHTNPAHNTPGQTRQDQPGQQDLGQPGQDETQSYPGIKGPKARDLQQDSAIDKQEAEQVKGGAKTRVDSGQSNPNPQAAPSSPLKPKDDTPVPLGKESRNDQ